MFLFTILNQSVSATCSTIHLIGPFEQSFGFGVPQTQYWYRKLLYREKKRLEVSFSAPSDDADGEISKIHVKSIAKDDSAL